MQVSRRCFTHHANNCQHGFCVDQERINRLHPGLNKPKATEGAPETGWAHPWTKQLEIEQLTGS
jgi:hypothetical protein